MLNAVVVEVIELRIGVEGIVSAVDVEDVVAVDVGDVVVTILSANAVLILLIQ